VDARGERIGNTEIVPRGTADGYAQAAQREMVWGAIGILNDKLYHCLSRYWAAKEQHQKLQRTFPDDDCAGNNIVQTSAMHGDRSH